MSYSNYDVAHRFATGIGNSCRSSNMFFERDAIYSYGYHFPIAIKRNGKLLWNDQRYSATTSQHQGNVMCACRQYEFVHCATLNNYWPDNQERFIKENFRIWSEDVKEIIGGPMVKARKPEKYLAKILGICNKVERFCKEFKVRVPAEFKQYLGAMDRERVLEVAKETARKEAERKKREIAKAEKMFMEFKSSSFRSDYQIVRYNKKENRFETSLHVEIPFEIGRRFYEALKNKELKVGDKCLWYTVLSVGPELKVGCHKFKRAWLLNFGKKVFANA